MTAESQIFSPETAAFLSSTFGQKSGCAIFAKYYFILHLVGYGIGIFLIFGLIFLAYTYIKYYVEMETGIDEYKERINQYKAERDEMEKHWREAWEISKDWEGKTIALERELLRMREKYENDK